ncbi:hypothetical protein BGY98DRAFT_1088820 [Russula aff. rugulosa BPL654]|nr:hypothetical protein BGY98DRAFT_1088820 [Russula aff. rugulosa BPL654]
MPEPSPSTETAVDTGTSTGNRDEPGPSGPARTPGTRTPRRVQWAAAVDEDEDDGDHHGLEPAAFRTLTHALERHHRSNSASPLLTRTGSVPAQQSSQSQSSTPSSAESSGPASPKRPSSSINLPGEAFIEPHERAGLPVLRSEHEDAFSDSEVRAAHVVRAHSRKPFKFSKHFFRRRRPRAIKERRDNEGIDREEAIDTSSPMTRMHGGGILAALLALYDHDHDRDSDMASVSDKITDPGSSGTRTPDGVHTAAHSLLDLASASGKRLATASKALHVPEPRPRRERNAAGVWGPLIASTTGTFVGVTAPTHSTIAPDVKRSGYRLSRFSLKLRYFRRYSLENNIPRASTVFPLQRSRSMLFEAGTQHHQSPTSSSQTNTPPNAHPDHSARGWMENLRDLSKLHWYRHAGSPPDAHHDATESEGVHEKGYHSTDTEVEGKRDVNTWRRERKKRRRKAEIYITRHISSLISRQTFILKLARAMMMFGGPTHRLQAQIQSTARVLEISLSCLYLPDVMLVAFDDDVTSTSSVKLIRQGSALDLGKLQDAHKVYWRVIHDDISVTEASAALDALMLSKPLYSPLQLIFFGGMASASICSVSFNGSLVDSLISFPLGALLVSVQILSVRNELYSNVFEITIATLLSFLSGALAQTHKFCYSAVASSSVGFIVLCGSLELSSRNIVAGAVRLCYALMYSLFLGFGLAIGAEFYEKMTGLPIFGPEDYLCASSHSNAPWYRKTPSQYWAFLTVPMYSLFLSLRNQAPWYRKELAVLVAIACVGWVTNHFVGTRFPNQSEISAAVGSCIRRGVIANIYGRFFRGNAFAVMITGILFQLPSGLGSGGLLHFASQQASGSSSSTSYLTGFQVALQLISVSVGLTVGLSISLVLVFPIQSRKRKSGVFSL